MPNAVYVVRGDPVFVFDKLVAKIKEHRGLSPDIAVTDLAVQLRPALDVDGIEPTQKKYTHLAIVESQDGFTPIPRALFEAI